MDFPSADDRRTHDDVRDYKIQKILFEERVGSWVIGQIYKRNKSIVSDSLEFLYDYETKLDNSQAYLRVDLDKAVSDPLWQQIPLDQHRRTVSYELILSQYAPVSYLGLFVAHLDFYRVGNRVVLQVEIPLEKKHKGA